MSLLEELQSKRQRKAVELADARGTARKWQESVDHLTSEVADLDVAISALTPPLQHKGGETEAGDKLAEFMKLDGAVKWEGGEMPVPVGATVDVLFNDGNLIEASRAEIWSRVPHGHDYWRDKPFNTRIVAYRIIATMSEHDRSAKSPLDERVWVHFMSAGGFSGGNGWSDELDWTKVDLYEIRPEGPPHLALSEPPISTLQASSGEGETTKEAIAYFGTDAGLIQLNSDGSTENLTSTEPAAYSPVNNADEPVTKPEADVFYHGLQAEAEAKKDPVSKLFGAGGLFGKREVVS